VNSGSPAVALGHPLSTLRTNTSVPSIVLLVFYRGPVLNCLQSGYQHILKFVLYMHKDVCVKKMLKTKASMPSHNFYICLYKNNINVQSSIKKQKQEHSMREFQLVGFNGAIGSPDATHIAIKNCCYQLRNNNLGPKQHLTTCTFNLTVNHWCQILSTTAGYPAR